MLELAEPPVSVAEKKPVAKAVLEALNPPRELFHLNDSHLADLKGPKSKVIANLAAIKVITDGGEVTAEDKAKLAAYSGWGGLSSVFAHTGEFHNEQKMLLEMVGPEAYATARESVLTAYYTEPEVIQNVWRLVRSLGFEGGRVLDPCTGTGHFVGAMPKDMREKSRITMVEPDTVSSKIARALYGDSQTIVHGSGIETAPIRSESYDLVLLDLGLPKRDGLQVLRALRSRHSTVPVLIATARDGVSERIAGLDAGADDYVVKPYDTDELLARIRALLRRSAGRGEPAFVHKGVSLNPATREATLNGQPVQLSAREWAVLEPLIARPGVVLSRVQLEEKLFSWKDDVSSNAVEVYIHGVRKKLGNDFIQTVRGLGYLVPKE